MVENISVLMAFGAGLLAFLSPCVLPLIPSYLCVIGGAPLASENNEKFNPRLVARTAAFTLGFSAVFIVLSVVFAAAIGSIGSIGSMGGAFRLINIVSGAAVVLLGLNMIFNFLSVLNYEKRFQLRVMPRGFAGAFIAGCAFGAGWTPCVGPVLTGILLMAAQSGGVPKAVLYLAFFSAGLGVPFVLASLFFNRFLKASAKLRARLPLIRRISGILLIIIGITILTGHYRALSALAAKWQSSLSAGGQPEADGSAAAIPAGGGSQPASDNAISPEVTEAFMSARLPVATRGIVPPDFTVPLLDGGAITLSELKGKVVFLNFWATWCGPCRAEMPSMNEVYRRLRDSGFEILAVNIQENPASVAAFMKEYSLEFPAALDRDGSVSAQYGIQAIPTSYIIDRRGRVVSRLMGSIDWNTPEIIAALESLL